MSDNSFGRLLRVTTWGESHGPAIGCVIDGCPPGLELGEADIQPWLDRRRPGASRFVTQRREPDQVRILSGVFEGRTTGTPISLMIENVDARSKDYAAVAEAWRPGHADFTYDAKYGLRDPRGGGRSSARETAMRVAAGAVARRVLGDGVSIRGCVRAIGGDRAEATDWDEPARNPVWSPDAAAAARWEALLDAARAERTSLGALVEVEAHGVPAGWGAPIYAKLDAALAGALMSINAVKAVQIGDGWDMAAMRGHEAIDPIRAGPTFQSNHAGGILGGISTGQPIRATIALKPTSSIPRAVETVTRAGDETELTTTGRHDPCVGIRAVPVAEAMLALVLADAMLQQRAQCG
jgi:chorismate synthase